MNHSLCYTITGSINSNQKEGFNMPRGPRKRDENQSHHIISRSIEEVLLFNTNQDKEYYLHLIKRAARIYRVCIITYCLMDNHMHLLVHPQGGDIAKFMRSINNPYAKYYNRTNGRRGTLFSERYKNIIIKDEAHLLRTSTYIHNNAKDLLWQGFDGIKDYPYSSIKDYLKPSKGRGIADSSFIYKVMGGSLEKAQKDYAILLDIQTQGMEAFEEEMEQALKKGYYETDKKPVQRDVVPEKVINTIAILCGVSNIKVCLIKYAKANKRFKELVAISLRIFCDMSLSKMTHIFKGYTSSSIGGFARSGYIIFEKNTALYDEVVRLLAE